VAQDMMLMKIEGARSTQQMEAMAMKVFTIKDAQ
jgi:hypothetical protein